MKNNPFASVKWVSIYSIIVVISILLSVGVVSAHSPTEMELQYDNETGTTGASITHTVENPNEHYIERVEIRKNGELVTSEDYTSQPTDTTFSYNYEVEANIGDTIQVQAFCNRFGSISRTLSLTKGGPKEPEGGGIPWLMVAGIIAVIAIVALAAFYSRR